MIDFATLTVANNTITRTQNWVTDALVVENYTPYPVYVNWRTSAIPSLKSHDKIIPSGTKEVFPAIGDNFGFLLDTPAGAVDVDGQEVIITFQHQEVLPNFGEAHFRVPAENPFALTGGTPNETTCFSAGGSQAVAIAINTTLGGVDVIVSTSPDGVSYTAIDYFQLQQSPLAANRIYPATNPYFCVSITKLSGFANANGTLSWSLLSNYTPVPSVYNSIMVTRGFTSIASGGAIDTSFRAGNMFIDRLQLAISDPVGNVNFAVQVFAINERGVMEWRLGNNISTAVTNAMSVGAGLQWLVYRRGALWAWEIPVQLQSREFFRLFAVNPFAVNCLMNLSYSAREQI